MKNVAIITIWDMLNYGNRLQNYAVTAICEKKGLNPKTIVTDKNKANTLTSQMKSIWWSALFLLSRGKRRSPEYRSRNFKKFTNKYIPYKNVQAEEEINNALKQAHIYHFVQTLPGNLDYVLNEDGTNISQGQRQLLTIARAIISKPKILILDEATSSVDTRTEQKIQDALDTIMKNRTSFVIAHRLSTIKNAKLIIVMKKGNIVEVGNHQELLNKNGFYADLYNSQFSGVNPMENSDKNTSES